MPVAVSDDPVALDGGEPCPDCCDAVPPSDCTQCCDPPPPSVLYATFTGLSPSTPDACGCFHNSVSIPLTYVGTPACRWQFTEGSPTSGDPLCAGDGRDVCTHSVFLDCELDGTWSLQWAFGDSINGCVSGLAVHIADDTADETDCDPLTITFNSFTASAGAPATYCGTLANITVTVTE